MLLVIGQYFRININLEFDTFSRDWGVDDLSFFFCEVVSVVWGMEVEFEVQSLGQGVFFIQGFYCYGEVNCRGLFILVFEVGFLAQRVYTWFFFGVFFF